MIPKDENIGGDLKNNDDDLASPEDDNNGTADDVLVVDNKVPLGQLQSSSSMNNIPAAADTSDSSDKDATSADAGGGGGGFKNLKMAINQKRKLLKKGAAGSTSGEGDDNTLGGGIAGDNINTKVNDDWIIDELLELFKAIAGYNSLNSSPYPNTAPIGNVSILQAIEKTSDLAGFGNYLKGKLFMGKRTGTALKSRMDVPLSTRDDEEMITSQWNALK